MIFYTQSLDELTADMLDGFFVGWPNPPSKQSHLKILKGSYCFWAAIDNTKNKVVGFITAISDGVISAYIPLLEVLPDYQSAGIGKELVSRMVDSLKNFYMVDLLCDEPLQEYYSQFGMNKATGSFLRNYEKQSCDNPIDKRGKLETEIFTYKITKDKKVFISWQGKHVTTLSGVKADSFIDDIADASDNEAQLIMAKVTGNFKRGNEKSNHHKNINTKQTPKRRVNFESQTSKE